MTTSTSSKTPLFQEAILEVNKIKEIATEDAKRALVEAMAPMIKKEIDRNISSMTRMSSFLFEELDENGQESDPLAAPASPDPGATPFPAPASPDGTVPPATLPVPATAGGSPMDPLAGVGMPGAGAVLGGMGGAPIQPSAAGMNIPLSDMSQDGKLTIDFAALFAATPDGSEPVLDGGGTGVGPDMLSVGPDLSGAPPVMDPSQVSGTVPPMDPMATGGTTPPPPGGAAPVEPTSTAGDDTDPLSMDSFNESVNRFVARVSSTPKPSALVKQAFEAKLFEMCDQLQSLVDRKMITPENHKLQESKLEQLYSTIKETAKDRTSYDKKALKEEKMKSLKDFAKALFNEDAYSTRGSGGAKGAAGFGDGSKPPQKNVDEGSDDATVAKSGTHAQKASESRPVADPGIKDSHDVDRIQEGADEQVKLEAELREMFGEDDMSSDDEPMEEASTAKPGAAKKVEDLNGKLMDPLAGGTGGHEGKGAAVIEAKELAEAAKKARKDALLRKEKQLKEEAAKVAKQLKECDMSGAMGGASQPMGTIELHADTVNINVTGDAGAMGGAPVDDLSSMGDDDTIEVVDDTGEDGLAPSSDDGSTPDGDVDASSSSDEDDDSLPFGESVKRGAGSKAPTGAQLVKENKELKEHVQAFELLTARSVYLNKFLSRDDLSRKHKRQIVEYLDSARTLAEAKMIYGRIKSIIETAKARKADSSTTSNKAGSSSTPAKSGAALNESVDAGTNPYAPTAQRWMELAGIKPKIR